MSKKDDALLYHSDGRPGKIQVVPTKSHSTQRDLSLAYSPGVAEPCLEIEPHPPRRALQPFPRYCAGLHRETRRGDL